MPKLSNQIQSLMRATGTNTAQMESHFDLSQKSVQNWVNNKFSPKGDDVIEFLINIRGTIDNMLEFSLEQIEDITLQHGPDGAINVISYQDQHNYQLYSQAYPQLPFYTNHQCMIGSLIVMAHFEFDFRINEVIFDCVEYELWLNQKKLKHSQQTIAQWGAL